MTSQWLSDGHNLFIAQMENGKPLPKCVKAWPGMLDDL
jgi:hypothetical protein